MYPSLLDNEFGDFTSAPSVQFPANTGPTVSSLDGIFFSNFSNTEAYPSNQNVSCHCQIMLDCV